MKLVLVSSLVLTSCTAIPAAHECAVPAVELGLPPVRGPLVFPPETEEITLAWLLDELGRLTGQELTMDANAYMQLEQQRERLEQLQPVPAHEVYAFVEALLVPHSFVLAPLKSGERPVLGVYAGWGQSRSESGGPKAIALADDQLGALEQHPALCFQLVLTFQNIDSRQLQTQLRQLLVDNTGFTQVVPAGDRSLLLQGTGAKLASLVQTLREVDRASAARPKPAVVEPAKQDTGPR